MGRISIGINLEFVRRDDKPFEWGVMKAAELGYDYVEPMLHWGRELLSEAGYFHSVSMLDDPLRPTRACEKYGVRLSGVSAHTPLCNPEISTEVGHIEPATFEHGRDQPIAAKRVGEHDAAARVHVRPRNPLDDIRVRQIPAVGALTAGAPSRLHLRSPSTVGHNRSAGDQFGNVIIHGSRTSNASRLWSEKHRLNALSTVAPMPRRASGKEWRRIAAANSAIVA